MRALPRVLGSLALLLLLLALPGLSFGADSPSRFLARVDLEAGDLDLDVLAELEDAAGVEYAVVVATREELEGSGLPYRILDEYREGRGYLYGSADRAEARARAREVARVLYDDGENLFVRFDPEVRDELSDLGFEMVLLDDEAPGRAARRQAAGTPILPPSPEITRNPRVQRMLDEVSPELLRTSMAGLSGEEAVTVGGRSATFTTRNTDSEEAPLVTQYLREVLEEQAEEGLTTSFQDWAETEEYEEDGEELTYTCKGRNLVAELPGGDLEDEVIVLVAHADSICDSADEDDDEAPAPGADDDASGCAALLEMARIMSGESFRRTVRFVFTMGEEQGILGSKAYVHRLEEERRAGGPTVRGVLNLDMIAYSTGKAHPPRCRIKTRSKSSSAKGYRADAVLAEAFVEVIRAYGLDSQVQPVLTDDSDNAGDQVRFWERGIPAAWAIQDDQDDWNPNYHEVEDDLEHTNGPYCTAVVKATLGTAAHLAELAPER